MNDARIIAPRVMTCMVCAGDTDSEQATLLEVTRFGPGLGLAVAICPRCTARAVAEDGDTNALFADVRESYPQLATLATVGVEPEIRPVELQPRKPRNAGRKHPAYGAALAADPPPADEPLRVLVGWQHADAVPDPKLIVRDGDNPGRLRFDVAAGRCVRVFHRHDADPNRLFGLAQCLIDYGAREVQLVIHPPRPEAHGTEMLRIVPTEAA